jgi:predicted acylesterase/phospholipase RssA
LQNQQSVPVPSPEELWRPQLENGTAIWFAAILACVVIIGLGGVGWLMLGVAAWGLGLGVPVALALTPLKTRWLLPRVEKKEEFATGRRLWWVKWTGMALVLLAGTLVMGLLTERLWSASIFGAIFVTLFQVLIAPLHKKDVLPVAAAVVLGPIFAGWAVASLAGDGSSDGGTVRAWLEAKRPSRSVAVSRAHCGGSTMPDGLRVAVALSGGGYRAALTHAGVLAALDEACTPIHILSSVSGGSIIAAAYALGVPPGEFAGRLAAQKPGLPTMLLSMKAVVLDLTWPSWSVAETYAAHFRRTYYGDASLSDLPASPLLLVNVTDIEAGPDRAREVLFKGRGADLADGKSLDASTRVADVVAASGAFPGAFRPKRLRWPDAEGRVATGRGFKERKFVDGGVVDNFGVEGLRRYLTLPRNGRALPARPHLLIVSDASGYGGPATVTPKPDAVTLITRSTAFSYEALHRQLYTRYTGVPDLFEWVTGRSVGDHVGTVSYRSIDARLDTGAPDQLVTVAIPVTSEAMQYVLARYSRCRNDRGEDALTVHGRVSVLSTLYELSPDEVRDAFWLGYTIGRIYRPAIECAQATVAGRACRRTSPISERESNATMTCPPVSHILRVSGAGWSSFAGLPS